MDVALLEFKQYCIRYVEPFATHTDGELATMTCGPEDQCTRHRSDVIVECIGS